MSCLTLCVKTAWMKDKIIECKLASALLPKAVVNRPKKPFYFPIKYFFESPQFNELLHLTLNERQILKRGYFDPAYIRDLIGKTNAIWPWIPASAGMTLLALLKLNRMPLLVCRYCVSRMQVDKTTSSAAQEMGES